MKNNLLKDNNYMQTHTEYTYIYIKYIHTCIMHILEYYEMHNNYYFLRVNTSITYHIF